MDKPSPRLRVTGTRLVFGLCSALTLQLCACERFALREASQNAELQIESAQFGVFFGGQIQERDQIPFELDGSKQQLGFRVVLEQAAPSDQELRWEVSRPRPKPRGAAPLSKPEGRTTQLFRAIVAKGETRFEHPLALVPGDPLGLWNLRVTLGDGVLIDRPFVVYDPVARQTAIRRATKADAGL